MARLRRGKSRSLETARQRLAGLKQFTVKANFAPPLSEESYEAEIAGYLAEQDAYNGDVAALDDKSNRLDARDRRLADLNVRVLAAVKAQFGPDSSEFELVGGLRQSDRKRPVRTTKTKAA